MEAPTPDRITSIIRPMVAEAGLIHVETVVRGHHRTRVIEVFVDGETGVTADTCASLSRSISGALDAGIMRGEDYTLTVSSPGIERALTDPRQFTKHTGRRLKITLLPSAGGGTLKGVLRSASGDSITLEPDGGGGERTMNIADLAEARVELPW